MSQDKKNVNIEEICNKARESGLSEGFIQWTMEHLDLLEKLSDDNFENNLIEESDE